MRFFRPAPVQFTNERWLQRANFNRLPQSAAVCLLPRAIGTPEMLFGGAPTYSSVTIGMSKFGPCLDMAGAAGVVSIVSGLLAANRPSSVELLFEHQDGAGNKDLCSAMASGNLGFCLVAWGGKIGVDMCSGGGGIFQSNASITNGQTYHVVGTCNAAGSSNSIYINGLLDKTAGTFANGYTGAGTAKIGGTGVFAAQSSSKIVYGIFYNQELTQAEISARAADPLGFLDADEAAHIVNALAGGGGFNPAWAANSNGLIGMGAA